MYIMKEIDIEEMERILGRSITLGLSLNDLRIIVSCFNAVAYWAEVDEKAYLDSDAWKLKERLEGLYRDELDYPFPARKEEPSLCIGY
jgi:hypothetical protein